MTRPNDGASFAFFDLVVAIGDAVRAKRTQNEATTVAAAPPQKDTGIPHASPQ